MFGKTGKDLISFLSQSDKVWGDDQVVHPEIQSLDFEMQVLKDAFSSYRPPPQGTEEPWASIPKVQAQHTRPYKHIPTLHTHAGSAKQTGLE